MANRPSPGARFRQLLVGDDILVLPGCFECIGAKMIESLGFGAVYVSGGGTSCTRFGLPDIGVTTMSVVVENSRSIALATDLPVFSDADNGYGNAINVARTVRSFDRAGVAGVHLEDQVMPKRCGQYEGKELIPQDEMVQKIRAACDAREDESFVIMARTDAIPVTGFDDALRRADAYLEAGADLVWVESTRDMKHIEKVGAEFGPRAMHNMDASGKSPKVTVSELKEMGFAIASFCGITIWSTAWVIREQLGILKETGDIDQVQHLMVPSQPGITAWQDTYNLLGFEGLMEMQRKYAVKAAG